MAERHKWENPPKRKKRFDPPRMTDEDKKRFVDDFCSGRVFTMHQVRQQDLVGTLFMPIAFGALAEYTPKSLKENLGTVWEYMNQAGPRALNGYPMFFSCHLMHKKDWEELLPMIEEENKRRGYTPPPEPGP